MTFNQALALLQQVHNGDESYYLSDISEEVGEYSLGIKRKSKDECISLSAFVECDELLEFEKSNFYVFVNGVGIPYPFKCDDFLADDWECCLVDWDGKHCQTFTEFLQDKFDELLENANTAINALNRFLKRRNNIKHIEVRAIFSGICEVLSVDTAFDEWLNDLQVPKNECFTLEVFYKDGESEYVCER